MVEFAVYPSVYNPIGMKKLLVVAVLSWHMEGGLALASAAFAFVSTSLGTSALLKSHTTQNLAALITRSRRLSRTSAVSGSPRELETIMMSPSYRYSGQRRRKYPASLQLINPRSTAFHYSQQRCFFDHRSDLSTTISCLQSMCSSWNISLSGRGSSRAPYGARTYTMLLRDTVTTRHRRCSSDGKERQILSLASSRSTGNWGSTPGYRRQPPEEEDIWSKSSVFEFRSVNDPDTNTSMYRRGSDDDSKDSPALKKSRQPHQQSESKPYQTEYAEEAIPAETPPAFMTPESAKNDWFRFQEKEHLVQPRVNNVSGGVSRDNGDAKVELSTQLGLPATATHEELRTEYVVEVKRCHPDMAGDNEFRAKMLERRFQRLTAAWDLYTEELRNPSPQQSTTRFAESVQEFSTDTITETEACLESDDIARDRARERARAEYLKAEAKARAATAAKQYTSGVDPGRKYLDTGASSC